jgi:hypothetical protein
VVSVSGQSSVVNGPINKSTSHQVNQSTITQSTMFPITRSPIANHQYLHQLHPSLVPDHEPVDARLAHRLDDLDIVPEDARLDPDADILDVTIAEDDAELDLAVQDAGSVTDGRMGADVAVLDMTILSDADRSPDARVDDM